MNKLTDFHSPEKDIILKTLDGIPLFDIYLATLIENYIYSYKEERYPDNNHLRKRYRVKYNKKDGEYKEWYSNCDTLSLDCYYIDGLLNGIFTTWYSNGNIWSRFNYTNNIRNGEYKEWFHDGNLYIDCQYKNNLINGEYKEWYVDGLLLNHNEFENGRLIKYTEYDQDGNLKSNFTID
jgi:antitoxin component YwqK of YwqJK toxin-antitoxin module